MHTYDISLTISPQLPTWPGDPSVVLERIAKIEEGSTANVSRFEMCVHTGTHVDAPYHFLSEGKSVEKMSLRTLTGRAYVLDLTEVDQITADILDRSDLPPRTRRLLFKTRNSDLWARQENEFKEDFVGICEDAAEYLVKRGVKLVGVDYLSVAPFHNPGPTHEIFLEAGVVVVEGLDLSEISQGRYTLYCLPLKLDGSDGAPARAILVGV
jgi:arylformamidase